MQATQNSMHGFPAVRTVSQQRSGVYIHDLEQRLESLERDRRNASLSPPTGSAIWTWPDAAREDGEFPRSEKTYTPAVLTRSEEPRRGVSPSERPSERHQEDGRDQPPIASLPARQELSESLEPGLSNPFGLGFANYDPDRDGKPLYFGPSSNWSFGRRVLSLAYKRIRRTPLPLDNLLFEGKVYKLGWDGKRNSSTRLTGSQISLPAPDFAAHLINLVDFHCTQLFYLFDKEIFMRQFTLFHESAPGGPDRSSLWYVHYLLILSFGKAYAVQTTTASKAAGTEFFVEAMQLLPDFMFIGADPIELTQVLCCAALFFHCLEFRCAAYKTIGWAVRLSLENGLHSDMKSQYISTSLVQRCRKLWWTVYILDQQMSALMGAPAAVAEESIAAPLPDFPKSPQRLAALDFQIRLNKLLARVLNTIYGPEGSFKEGFLASAKDTLKSLASLTDLLNTSFSVCVILTTRPILYSILEAKLAASGTFAKLLESQTTNRLVQVCIESAQQTLNILGILRDQTLLESVLPFDLESTFVSTLVILMAHAVDTLFIKDSTPWSSVAYSILDEMIRRGNLVAALMKSELQQLESTLRQLPVRDTERRRPSVEVPSITGLGGNKMTAKDAAQPSSSYELLASRESGPQLFQPGFGDTHRPSSTATLSQGTDAFWQTDGFTGEQLVNVADSIDLDGLEWLSDPAFGDLTHDIAR
ncbi:hypothetical protein AYO21_02978 [Fonsecaea monophora]|uniref:Xylanolytic transcriptional activator regulatory domain-containing protein n=1 Tax=Fonsecaea monophora TaxID=254056 RepID=A0A177FEL2_9EURO|nr:hypothetical protein AYO21_02978 [Fonsecaea monophora]OAG42695.1 hypothetical protein AYO21_02978 [Fonsecaea monophora]